MTAFDARFEAWPENGRAIGINPTAPYPHAGGEEKVSAHVDSFVRGKFEDIRRDALSPTFKADVRHVFEEAEALLLRKHLDYGATNISRSPGGPLNGLRVRMWDKQARINHLLDSDAEPENESLRDSFVDLLNYSAIALLVLEGRWPNE